MVNKLVQWIRIEYDGETIQYTIYNDLTPGVYGVWETKQEAIREYLSGLEDFICINFDIKNDIKTFA